MALDFLNTYPTFDLAPNHVYIINSEQYRFAYKNSEAITFSRQDDPARKISFDIGTLNRMNGAGLIEVLPDGHSPDGLRRGGFGEDERRVMAGLSAPRRQTVDMRYAFVRAVIDLRERDELTLTEASIDTQKKKILDMAKAYLEEELPDPEYALAVENWKNGNGKKPKTRAVDRVPSDKSARTILGWVRRYKAGGKVALIDSAHNQGNHSSYFRKEEMALMAKVVQKEYMNLNRKTIVAVHKDLKAAIEDKNASLEDAGQEKLRCPGYETLRLYIASIDKFHKLVARFGVKTALKKMGAVKTGMDISRPLQRVEMDEWKIDLLTLLKLSGLLDFFSEQQLTEMGFLDENGQLRQMKRWWLVATICCRTRCILGMVLTANPQTSGAIKCLQMTMSDKGRFADAVGALSPWSMFGTPETLAVDNGSAFKAIAFTSACTDAGVTKISTIAGSPGMRGMIERMFSTLRSTLLCRLPGRTFSDTIERGDHPAEERACLSIDDIAFILVRWIVDVYHNTPHQGLGGLTPLQQWEADLKDGNFPLHSAPSLRRRRLAFGLPMHRMVQKSGIRALNVQYNNGLLHSWFLKNGSRSVEVRWLNDNISAIEVQLDGKWVTVPASSDVFKDIDADTWNAVQRALKTKDPKRTEWDEHVVLQTIRVVEDLKRNRMSTLNILDTAWTLTRFNQIESEASASLSIVTPRETTSQTSDGFGVSVVAVEPMKPESETSKVVEAAKTVQPATEKWSVPTIGKPKTDSNL